MSDNENVIINGRSYPSRYTPGTHWSTDEAWRILDTLKEGAISNEIRCFLAGMIAGALAKERTDAVNARYKLP